VIKLNSIVEYYCSEGIICLGSRETMCIATDVWKYFKPVFILQCSVPQSDTGDSIYHSM
jgi:hypothetical protein